MPFLPMADCFSMGVTCHLCLFVDVASWSLPQLITVLFF